MTSAALTLLVLTVAGHTVTLRSDKPAVTARDSARIELRVVDEAGRPLRDASVSLSVNVGSVTPPAATREGVFTATYRPPTQEGPQVALFHAAVNAGAAAGTSGWLALPVHGRQQLRVEAPPRARVRVSIGKDSFGPVVAGAEGSATVQVEVPPGASSAEVSTVERSGRRATRQVPLPPAPFARVRIVAPSEAPSWEKPLRLQGFVVDERGMAAISLPPLAVSVERGTLGPIEPKEGGAFEVLYTAPEQAGAPVTLSAATLEDSERVSTARIEPRPGALARLGLTLSSPSYKAGSNEEIALEAVGYDAKGNVLPAPPVTFSAEVGALQAEPGGRRARIRPPDAFGAKKALALRVQAGALQGQVELPLQSGPPVRGEATVDTASVKVRGEVEVMGFFVDAWGNPVDGLRVVGSSPGGSLRGPEPLGEGRYRFYFTPSPGQPSGATPVELRPEGFPVSASGTVAVPSQRGPWQPTLGVLVLAQNNFALSRGFGVRLDGALRLAELPVEALVQLEGRQNQQEKASLQNLEKTFTLRGFSGRLGARWSQPVLGQGLLFADASAGLLVMGGELTLVSQDVTLKESIQSRGLIVSVGGGFGWTLGAGRLMGQVHWAYAPGLNGQVSGNLGGLSVGLGYQLPLFGGTGP